MKKYIYHMLLTIHMLPIALSAQPEALQRCIQNFFTSIHNTLATNATQFKGDLGKYTTSIISYRHRSAEGKYALAPQIAKWNQWVIYGMFTYPQLDETKKFLATCIAEALYQDPALKPFLQDQHAFCQVFIDQYHHADIAHLLDTILKQAADLIELDKRSSKELENAAWIDQQLDTLHEEIQSSTNEIKNGLDPEFLAADIHRYMQEKEKFLRYRNSNATKTIVYRWRGPS